MSNAKKCDICGVYYDDRSKEESNRPLLNEKYSLTGVTLIFEDGWVNRTKDLCSQCAKKLYERFNGGM